MEEIMESGNDYQNRLQPQYEKYKRVNIEVLKWLANNIDENPDPLKPGLTISDIVDLLNSQLAVSYLLVWPILEQRQFSGFMKVSQIKEASYQLCRFYNNDLRQDLDGIIKTFFDRYNISDNKNNPFLKNLQPEHDISDYYKNILRKRDFSEVKPREKISLLLFVIYRYRNNIFHGAKSIDRWTQYTDQINDCLIGMMKIADCMKKNKIVIPRPDNNHIENTVPL